MTIEEQLNDAEWRLELALAQLEAMYKRTCGYCKHFDADMDEDCGWDGYCNMLGDYFNKSFYCKSYEQKELLDD